MARVRLLVATATAIATLAACGQGSSGTSHTASPSRAVDAHPQETSGTRPAKPNILLVMTDDMRADDVQYMPYTQRFFAERGTSFRNMFAPTPLCCPNRASYLTAEYTHNHKVWFHDDPWGYGSFDDSHTLATALHDAGYRTGYVGKYLNLYGRAKPKVDPQADPATYVPHGWDEWRASPDGTGLPESDPRAGGTYRYFDTTLNVNGTLVGHQGEYNSDVIVGESRKVLKEFEGGDKPWYLQINSLAPHFGAPKEHDDPPRPLNPARPEWVKGMFDEQIPRGVGVPESGQPERDNHDKAWITRKLKPFNNVDRTGILALSRQRAETLFALDVRLSGLLGQLEKSGELDDTIVAFTSDNGYMEGEHRWRSGKIIGFEPSYRVPLMIAGPGVPRGGDEVMPVNTVNLSASVLDWAGARLPHSDGHSFVDAIGKKDGWDEALGYEAYFPEIRNDHDVPGFEDETGAAVGVRTGQYFYVRYSNGDEELFDLAKDPLEMSSVARKPAYAAVKAQLRDLWDTWHDCKGADCRMPLPKSLRVSATEAARLDDDQQAATARYYGTDSR